MVPLRRLARLLVRQGPEAEHGLELRLQERRLEREGVARGHAQHLEQHEQRVVAQLAVNETTGARVRVADLDAVLLAFRWGRRGAGAGVDAFRRGQRAGVAGVDARLGVRRRCTTVRHDEGRRARGRHEEHAPPLDAVGAQDLVYPLFGGLGGGLHEGRGPGADAVRRGLARDRHGASCSLLR